MAKAKAPNFEEQLKRLQAIVQELEGMDLTLERNVALYKEGHALAESCHKLLEEAKHEISLCNLADNTKVSFTGQQSESYTEEWSEEAIPKDKHGTGKLKGTPFPWNDEADGA